MDLSLLQTLVSASLVAAVAAFTVATVGTAFSEIARDLRAGRGAGRPLA